MKNIDLHFDMTDFPGFNYHKGLVFSAHSKDLGFAIANGGQYESKNSDNKIRNAIGFDIDLISLIKIKKDS
jgi:ATP phosphoribosyltransferase regulatory subunit